MKYSRLILLLIFLTLHACQPAEAQLVRMFNGKFTDGKVMAISPFQITINDFSDNHKRIFNIDTKTEFIEWRKHEKGRSRNTISIKDIKEGDLVRITYPYGQEKAVVIQKNFPGMSERKGALPDDSLQARNYIEQGLNHARKRDHSKAAKAFREALKLRPYDAQTQYNLGMAYTKMGRPLDALKPFQEAIRLKSDYAKAYFGHGVAYGMMGRHREAAESFKKALHFKPNFPEARHYLNVANKKIKDQKNTEPGEPRK